MSFTGVEPCGSWVGPEITETRAQFGFDPLVCEHLGKPGLGLDTGKVEFRAPTGSDGEHSAQLVSGNRRWVTTLRWARYP